MNVKENLKVWQLLSEINKTGNLTDAAKSLDIPLSRASKLINQLEEELGYTVLDRSKKPALLTWEVKKLMPYVQRLLCNWKFISSPEFIKGTGVRKNLEYSLTVSFPVNSDGTKFINSLTHICRTKYPNLQLQFTSDCGETGLLNGAADIAWFGYRPKHEELFWVPSGYQFTFPMASKKYKKRFGIPKNIEELKNHTILMRQMSNGSYYPILENGQHSIDLSSYSQVFLGDASVCKRMLIQGEGIAIDIGASFVDEELESEEVFPILTGWHRPPWPISIACRKENKNERIVQDIIEMIRDWYTRPGRDHRIYWYKRLQIPSENLPGIYLPFGWRKELNQ